MKTLPYRLAQSAPTTSISRQVGVRCRSGQSLKVLETVLWRVERCVVFAFPAFLKMARLAG